MFTRQFNTAVRSVHLRNSVNSQRALLQFMGNPSEQNKLLVRSQLHHEISKAQHKLGKSEPLATSLKGMQDLIDSPHFYTIVLKHSKFVNKFMKSSHPLSTVAKTVLTNSAPSSHPNSKNIPVPLAFRGILVALIAKVFSTTNNQPQQKKLLLLAEINGLLEAGFNIHHHMLPQSGTDLVTKTANKLGVLVGDACLAKAASLISELDHPAAAHKISETLAQVSVSLMVPGKEHSDRLLKDCCETVVMLAKGKREEFDLVACFVEQLCFAYVALLEEDYEKCLQCKMAAVEALDRLGKWRPESNDHIDTIRNLTQAFLPVESQR